MGQLTSPEQGQSVSVMQACGSGDTSAGGGSKVFEGHHSAKILSMDEMGGHGEKISWKEMWELETFRASFTMKATYDVVSSPENLSQWYREDTSYSTHPGGLQDQPHSRLIHLEGPSGGGT